MHANQFVCCGMLTKDKNGFYKKNGGGNEYRAV